MHFRFRGIYIWYVIDNQILTVRCVGHLHTHAPTSGPLFTKRTDVLPQDLVKSRSREIECHIDRIAMKFDRHLGSVAALVPVKL